MARDPAQSSLFGGTEPARRYASPAKCSPKPAGYAAAPGTGPEGESCGTCGHCRVRTAQGRRFYKCGLMVASWSKDRGTDVVLKSPACTRWEKGQPTESHVRLRDPWGND